MFEDQLIRLALGKEANVHFSPGAATGKFIEEKAQKTKDAWVRHLVKALPGIDVLGKSGYTFKDDDGSAVMVDEVPRGAKPIQLSTSIAESCAKRMGHVTLDKCGHTYCDVVPSLPI